MSTTEQPVAPAIPESKPTVVVTIEAADGNEVEKLRQLIDELSHLGHKILHIGTSRHWLHG